MLLFLFGSNPPAEMLRKLGVEAKQFVTSMMTVNPLERIDINQAAESGRVWPFDLGRWSVSVTQNWGVQAKRSGKDMKVPEKMQHFGVKKMILQG